MTQSSVECQDLLAKLAAMPAFPETAFASLAPGEVTLRGPDGAFSPVAHCWHLADLEREGFGVRLNRLRDEVDPGLPDFEGGRIATERNYKSLSLEAGMAAFRQARLDNLAVLRSLEDEEWLRSGRQAGVGKVSLRDMPRLMDDMIPLTVRKLKSGAGHTHEKSV